MAFSAPAILKDKWPLFVKYGATTSCVYQEKGNSDYDGNDVTKPTLSSHSLEIVFDKIKTSLVDGSTIKIIDRIAIFPSLNLPVEPKINDLIVDSSLKEWKVKDTDKDPLGAHYELRVRPIK